jgi:hypothetical protein
MTAALASARPPARPEAATARITFAALAARETRRLVVNPVFLVSVVLAAWLLWTYSRSTAPVTEIGEVVGYPAILVGAFGMMAMFWLTRSMRASEPVTGVTPVSLPMRTAALCTAAAVPFACGILALIAFAHIYPVSGPLYGAFSTPARIAILTGQIAIPSLGGPLLGVALGRWVSFPGAAFVLFLIIFGWVNLVTILTVWHPGLAPAAMLRMFSPYAFWSLHTGTGHHITAWRGSPWFFLGWQLALCTIAVLVAVLRGAGGRVRVRIVRALMFVLAAAVILLVLAGTGGFSHPVTV